MSHAAHASHPHETSPPQALSRANVTMDKTAGRGFGLPLIVIGLVGAVAAVGMGFGNVVTLKHALATYHLATMSVLAMSLGAMFFVMIFHLTNAGWTATLRRQFENVASFLPYAFLLIVPTLVIEIVRREDGLFAWLSKEAAHTHTLQAKWAFFFGPISEPGTEGAFPGFFVLRAVLYGLIWTLISRKMIAFSTDQDRTAAKSLSSKARFMSAWALPLFALTTAFAAFDWLMSLDYVFASTMWGVYYFAGAAYSSVAVVTIILAVLRLRGKLEGAVTHDHFHDMGKLMFTFTVFWAYIGFSQYFLIWYSNIPEETAFYNFRARPEWINLGRLLIFGHFVVPFLILLFRGVKRSPKALIAMCLWAVFIEVCDLYWIVRPMVYATHPEDAPTGSMGFVVDALAIAGVLAVFAGYLIQKIPQTNLVAINDPRMDEGLHHKNYV